MKYILLLITLSLFTPLASFKGNKPCCSITKTSMARCTGSKYCSACRNCSRCAYCGSGGYCGVCRPDLFENPKEKVRVTSAEKSELVGIASDQHIADTTSTKAHKSKTKHKHAVTTKKTQTVEVAPNRISLPVKQVENEFDEADKKARGIFITVAVALLIVAIPIISSIVRKRKKARQEEEVLQAEIEAKKNLRRLIDEALQKSTINQDQYDELMRIYSASTSTAIGRQFEMAKKFKKRVDYLLSKYSEDEVLRILKHEYWIGMTEEQLIDCKGQPTKIEIEQLKTKTKRVFIYGNKSSGDIFNFVDGFLERFKDR